MPRASALISRMTKSVAQNARGAAVKLDSIARRALSRPTLSRLPCAALLAAPSRMLPRSPCSTEPADTRQESLPISDGRSSRSGLRQRRQPLGESGARAPAKSSVCASSSAQMTRVHPTPAPGRRLPPASHGGRATALPLFEPTGDGLARDAEGARQPAQTAAFVISAQDLFALFFTIRKSARLFATALSAIAAQITLAAIRSQAIPHQSLALAMLTAQSNGDHG